MKKSATFEPTSVSTPFRSGPGAIFPRFPTPGTSEFCGRATQFYTSPISRERAPKGAPGPSRGSRIEAKIAPGAPFKSDHRTPESLWAVPGRGEELISAPAGLPGPLRGASGSRIGARGPPRGFQPAIFEPFGPPRGFQAAIFEPFGPLFPSSGGGFFHRKQSSYPTRQRRLCDPHPGTIASMSTSTSTSMSTFHLCVCNPHPGEH